MEMHSFYNPSRKSVKVYCSEPDMTDKSQKNMCDINQIMQQYKKTGLLPHVNQAVARFIDNTQVMPLEQAHAVVEKAMELFYELPSKIRNLMDNDPRKLEIFINDPTNEEILVKYGLKTKKTAESTLSKVTQEPEAALDGSKTEQGTTA